MGFDWTFILTGSGLLTALTGAVLGIAWGAVPGLSVAMAMALLAGLTLPMSAEAAILFLVAVWTGAEFGGAVPAILLGIPGTPSAIPTQLAGHPLARRGEGGLALGAALTFSALGSWAGLLVLALLAPLMLELALEFSSWEMFLLVMLGVSICGTVTGRGQPARGWAMGCLGLLIALVGKDPIHGVERYTFGVAELNAGIRYLPVLIGVFGLVAAIEALGRETEPGRPAPFTRILPGIGMLRRYWRSAVRSSVIGTVIGAIPGVGANIASWVSYSGGERASGRQFSDGDLEGVVCSEAANNANIGGGLLPTTTLGIPGNSSSAMIVAALALHGVVLGPTVESDQPGFMLFLYVSLATANVLMFASALALVRPGVYLMSLPAGVVMPVVIVFCLLGTFAANYSGYDVVVMSGAAVAGFFLGRRDYPFAPLVLGAILGPMADENLRRSLLVHEGQYLDMLARPVGLVLLAAIAWSLYHGMRRVPVSP